jgi:hypothetical protein
MGPVLTAVGGVCDTGRMKGQQKPKKLGKKAPLKSLKEKRAAKRDAAKPGRGLDV